MTVPSNASEGGASDLRSRAFEPEQAASLSLPGEKPGWDLGPERRLGDRRSIARMLGVVGLGLGVLALAAAGAKRRRTRER